MKSMSPEPPKLVKYISHTNLYKALDEAAIHDINNELVWVALEKDEILIKQGDHGNSLCVLIKGRLGVSKTTPQGQEQQLTHLEPGAFFGETGLFTGEAQPQTITALEPSEVVLLPDPHFDRLVDYHPEVMTRFAKIMVPQLQRIQLREVCTALFGDLNQRTFERMEREMVWRRFEHGDVVVQQGESDHALYIVISGRLRVVTKDQQGKEQILAEVSRGETIGEMALITGSQRAATVYAIRDTVVGKLTKTSFDALIADYPELLTQITHLIVQRFQRSLSQETVKNPVMTMALIPASPTVPLAKFGKQLLTALSSFGPTLYLDSVRFDGHLNKDGAAQTPFEHPNTLVIGAWLSEQETIYKHIIYQADPEWTIWTQRCIQNADRILIVGWATHDPTPGPLEQQLQLMNSAAPVELILMHDPNTVRPHNTHRWLSKRQVQSYYHLRPNNLSELQRVARHLTGRAVGLVLGGGAARGFAHIGAIKAIEEAGLPIDILGGTSIGAIVAAVYALGWDYEMMVEAINTFMSSKKILDPTLPLVSFARSRKMSSVLAREFSGIQIEDLWLPYFAVSSNLSTAQPVIHQTGPLWKALRASASLPGVFTPVVEGRELLVDGAMTNNLPIDIMHELCHGGPVIAVDVSSEMDLAEDYDYNDNLSGWQVLWSKLNPFSHELKAPSIFATLIRCLDLNSARQKQINRNLADIFIDPAVNEFGPGDFEAYETLIERGYTAAQEAIRAWVEEEARVWERKYSHSAGRHQTL